jgi:hypothetical protein
MNIDARRQSLDRPRRLSLWMVILATVAVLATPFSASAQSPATHVRIAADVRTGGSRDAFDFLVGLAQIVTAISVPLLLLQIRASQREGRSARTRALHERYFAPALQTEASLTIAYLMVRDAGDCVDKIRAWEQRGHAEHKCLSRAAWLQRPADPYATPGEEAEPPNASVNQILRVFGFYEDFGTAFNGNDLVKKDVLAMFSTIPGQVLGTGWWWICWRRGGSLLGEDGTDLYEQLERMVKALRKKNSAPNDATLVDHVGILCVPADPRAAGDDSWDRSRRLSLALSPRRGALGEVISLFGIGSVSESAPPPRWRLTVVPETIDQKPDAAWKAQREHADQIAVWLSSLDQEAGIDRVIARLEAW